MHQQVLLILISLYVGEDVDCLEIYLRYIVIEEEPISSILFYQTWKEKWRQ